MPCRGFVYEKLSWGDRASLFGCCLDAEEIAMLTANVLCHGSSRELAAAIYFPTLHFIGKRRVRVVSPEVV